MTIYMLETYVKSNKQYNDGTFFESSSFYIFYLDNKNKRVIEESEFTFKGNTTFYISKTKHRSIKSYLSKLNKDFENISNVFPIYETKMTKIGEL